MPGCVDNRGDDGGSQHAPQTMPAGGMAGAVQASQAIQATQATQAAHADRRNVMDQFKGQSMQAIIRQLDATGSQLIIGLENTERDFNMGTIVRSANAFGVRHVHIIGRRQWNKRGAMMTDKYLHVHYHASLAAFVRQVRQQGYDIIAVDNITGAVGLGSCQLPVRACLVFGQEGPGVSSALVQAADAVVAIEQFGSTRSLNVGVAAGIAMYEWVRQHRLAGDSSCAGQSAQAQ